MTWFITQVDENLLQIKTNVKRNIYYLKILWKTKLSKYVIRIKFETIDIVMKLVLIIIIHCGIDIGTKDTEAVLISVLLVYRYEYKVSISE